MKQCPYCGAEYPDNAAVCAIDETPLEGTQRQKNTLEEPQVHKKTAALSIERLWTPYLILCSISSGFNVLICLAKWKQMNNTMPGSPLTMLRLVILLTPWAIVGIWWKNRSGVLAFIALGIIGAYVDLVTYGIGSAIHAITAYIVFTFLVRPQWGHMTWDIQTPEKQSNDTQPPQEPTPK